MADLTGQRGTLNILQSQRELDVGNKISLLEPESQPLAIFSRAAKKERTISPEFSWHEDTLDARYDATTATATNVATTIAVGNGTRFAEHDIAQITRTAENVRVTGVSTNTLTVVRGVGSTAAAINNADEIVVIGSAQPEGDTSKPARSTNPTKVNNYTQIFRRPFQSSGTLLASSFTHNPGDWDHQARKAGIEHAKDIELSFIHGRKAEDTTGSQPRRTTQGLLGFITTNQTDAGGVLTEAEFNGAMRQGFRYGRKKKLLLASPIVTGVLNAFAMGKLQINDQASKTYGMDVSRYAGPFGAVTLVNHWLLEGTKYGGYAIGVDMDEVAYRFLNGGDGENRDTKVKTNIQEPDRDGRKDEYLSEVGLQLGSQLAHFVLTGVTG